MSELKKGNRVKFYQAYGIGQARENGTWKYKRRRVQGTVDHIIPRDAVRPPFKSDIVFIRLDDASQYSAVVGMPINKVQRAKRG